MRHAMMRLFIPIGLASLLGACDADRSVAPGGAPALTTAEAPFYLSAAPSSLTATSIWWQDNSPDDDSFELHRSATGSGGTFSLRATLAANATSYIDGGLTSGAEYCYRIRSVRKRGRNVTYSAFSGTACTTTYTLPVAPSNLVALPLQSDLIRLTWTARSLTQTDFRVERSIDGGAWVVAERAPWYADLFDDYGRTPETLTCYRVFAVDWLGDSPASPSECATPMRAPSAVMATAAGSDAIDLTWRDESAYEDGYEVWRDVCFFPDYSNPDSYYCEFSAIATLGANVTSWRESGLAPGTEYTYTVFAVQRKGDMVGRSDPSNASAATTQP